jgi:ribA/ribD-fused uncharacterized protein
MIAILDLNGLRAACKSGQHFRYRPFYGHTARADGQLSDAVFSQFWPCSFVLGAQRYHFAEQWMMASKARLFGDAEACQGILRATAPLECKRIGRTVRGFDDARWHEHRFELVTVGNVAKFEQDPALAAYLLATGEEILVEASPRDRIWGIGLGRDHPAAQDPLLWRGQNLLGFALVRTRAILRGEIPRPTLPALFHSA